TISTDPPTLYIYTLSLHDALPICLSAAVENSILHLANGLLAQPENTALRDAFENDRLKAKDYYIHILRSVYRILFLLVIEERNRSEEHTSELQSRENLVCRLLLEK